MRSVRQEIGGLGNLMFKQAFLWMLMREGVIPDIYVQGEKYWAKYKNEIKQMFSHGIGRDEHVAIHIRRGDYLKAQQFHVALWSTDYYKKAVELFPDAQFKVFCKDNQDPTLDAADQEWCKEFMNNLAPERYVMHQHTAETDDMNAMASCQGIIMANSTFSWWAAYLSNAKVVCPSEWFSDGQQRCELLDEWLKI